MNTTYTANDNCFLIDGEVYLVSKTLPPMIGWWCIDTYSNTPVYCSTENYGSNAFDYFEPITHSTKPLDGVKLLPRDKFVKPVDVNNLADYILVPDYFDKVKEVSSTEWDIYQEYKGLIKAGYNANPNKFTREEMEDAIFQAYNLGWSRNYNLKQSEEIERIINAFRPLSLPAKLEINEQGEIVNVIW